MGISGKGKRKIVVNGKLYWWTVMEKNKIPQAFIICDDKTFVAECRLYSAILKVIKGRKSGQGLDVSHLEEKYGLIFTPQYIKALIELGRTSNCSDYHRNNVDYLVDYYQFGYWNGYDTTSITATGDRYTVSKYERGGMNFRREDCTEVDVIFMILNDIIGSFSWKYEHRNRQKYQDSRRLAFPEKHRLFAYVGEPYESMNEEWISKILESYPYNDKPRLKLDLTKDFERIANLLKSSRLSTKYSAEFHKNLDFFVNKNYRSPNGGIFDFDTTFANMIAKFRMMVDELKNSNLKNEMADLYKEILPIEGKISEELL